MIEYRNKRGIYHQPERKQKNLMKLSLLEWADRLKDHEELSDNARANIRYFHHGFSNFIEKQPAFDITPEEIDKHFLKEFVKYLQSLGLAGRTINGNYLWAIKAITEQLVDLGYLDSVFETKNYHVKQVKNESGKYPPLSNDEMQLAFNYFREWKDGYFYLFMLHIYYTCIRPAELHRLKVDYFNFQERTIFVPWFKSKNGLSRYVQILEPLYNALIERGIDKLAPGTYIFGAECMPSTVQYTLGKYSSKIWHKKREAMGMPKEKQLYGLKHTFNSNYVNNNKANIDWEWLRRHNRHATKEQTQDYIADITAYFLDETTSYIPDYHTGNNT
jgi:integrase